MSNLRDLKKPHKKRRRVLITVLSCLMAVVVIAGMLTLLHRPAPFFNEHPVVHTKTTVLS